jgi:hypothetical protein
MILVVAFALLVVIFPVGADHNETHTVYEHDAEISVMRWQAMANYYEDNGLLTRDTFDYEAVANNSAFRWQAMANYYEDNGLLTRDTFDYEAAANNSAFRWQAMADYYARQ